MVPVMYQAPPRSSLFGRGGDNSEPLVRTIDETNDLRAAARRIGEKLPRVPDTDNDQLAARPAIVELQYRTELIGRHMGSLALCRGSRGDALHEAGAVDAVLNVLAHLNRHEMLCGAFVDDGNSAHEIAAHGNEMVRLPPIQHVQGPATISSSNASGNDLFCLQNSEETIGWSTLDQSAIALASASLGAVRDMACGNSSNRAAIAEYRTILLSYGSSDEETTVTGPQILASYVKRYHLRQWEDILHLEGDSGRDGRGRKELRLLTDATGAIRNSSHSTPKTCAGLHSALVTEMFIWRLKQGSEEGGPDNAPTALPNASRPWREASFRIAGSLINISERCSACAQSCGSDLDLIRLLVEAWGGAGTSNSIGGKAKKKQTPASTPMLHLGLGAILHAADAISPLDEELRFILDKEDARKEFARKKEAERQKRIARGLK